MGGYVRYSMSKNAVNAYANGEKPRSKWTKSDILAELEEVPGLRVVAEKYSVGILKSACLMRSSWHHTSCRYNKTEFYTVLKVWTADELDRRCLELIKIAGRA